MTRENVTDEDKRLYVEAPEAAAMLGVSITTLYAYVSRKSIRSFPTAGTKRRRYWRADVEAIRDKLMPAGAPSPSTLVRDTELTLLTKSGLFYRGNSAILLSEKASLERVASILWKFPEEELMRAALPTLPRTTRSFARAAENLSALERALALLPLIEHANPKASDLSNAGFAQAGIGVVRLLAAIVVRADRPSQEPIHLFIARHAGFGAEIADLIRRMLVLVADHELDPTTYAVRAVANTGATPYAAIMTGLLAGRGLRNSRWLRVSKFVHDVLGTTDPAGWVAKLFRAGESIPGFEKTDQHGVADPRPEALVRAMRRAMKQDKGFRRLSEAMAAATELTGQPVELIVPVAFLGAKLGFPDDPLALPTIGRAVGWLAHALEQSRRQPLVRPRAIYVGQLPDELTD
jgi:citrate synthase